MSSSRQRRVLDHPPAARRLIKYTTAYMLLATTRIANLQVTTHAFLFYFILLF